MKEDVLSDDIFEELEGLMTKDTIEDENNLVKVGVKAGKYLEHLISTMDKEILNEIRKLPSRPDFNEDTIVISDPLLKLSTLKDITIYYPIIALYNVFKDYKLDKRDCIVIQKCMTPTYFETHPGMSVNLLEYIEVGNGEMVSYLIDNIKYSNLDIYSILIDVKNYMRTLKQTFDKSKNKRDYDRYVDIYEMYRLLVLKFIPQMEGRILDGTIVIDQNFYNGLLLFLINNVRSQDTVNYINNKGFGNLLVNGVILVDRDQKLQQLVNNYIANKVNPIVRQEFVTYIRELLMLFNYINYFP